jgi:hypothetical protein
MSFWSTQLHCGQDIDLFLSAPLITCPPISFITWLFPTPPLQRRQEQRDLSAAVGEMRCLLLWSFWIRFSADVFVASALMLIAHMDKMRRPSAEPSTRLDGSRFGFSKLRSFPEQACEPI